MVSSAAEVGASLGEEVGVDVGVEVGVDVGEVVSGKLHQHRAVSDKVAPMFEASHTSIPLLSFV